MKYYLAIDIGASSGRHILGYIENSVIKTEEVYRFKNGYKEEKPVTAGPTEATALGNLISQLIYDGVCESLDEARQLVIKSFNINEVQNV